MSTSFRLAAPAVVLLTLAACSRPIQLPTPETGTQSTQVVIVSAAGKLATSTPVGATTRIPPTPTFDPGFGAILTPLAMTPGDTPAPAGQSPTPALRPTRTPAPSVTPFPTLEIPPTAERGQAFTNPPTRTPGPPTATRSPGPTRPPTRTPTATPVDPNEEGVPNSDLANAVPITIGKDLTGLINGPKAVDVYSFDVTDDDDQIVVTLNGQDIDLYRLYLISPGRQQSAYGTALGANGRVIRFPARGETGTWYVEVTTDGKRVPPGSYSLRVDLRGGTPVPASTASKTTPATVIVGTATPTRTPTPGR